MNSRIPLRWLCCLFTATALPVEADEPRRKVVEAGPFSVTVPAAWTEGLIVENVPLKSHYTAEEWKKGEAADKASRDASGNRPLVEIGGTFISLPDAIPKWSFEIRPEHWAIRLPRLSLEAAPYDPKEAREDQTAPQILIHRSAEWGKALLHGKVEEADGVATIKELRRALDNMDTNGLPPGLHNGLEMIVAKKKLKFAGGNGYRLLTQYFYEPDLLRKGHLCYVFIGMSDDNSCQIIATVPIDLPGLPGENQNAEHLGFSTARYPELSKKSSTYQAAARKWLLKSLPEAKPSLAELDAVMQSLVVRGWVDRPLPR